LTSDLREQIERYLPLNPERVALFINEWEGFVLSCLRRMRIADDEEVLSLVIFRALNALPNFRNDSKISTWLYRITLRESLRHIQKQKRLAQKEVPLIEGEDFPDPGESALKVLERRETAEKVQIALSKLTLNDRETLALRYLEDLDIAEVARRLDIPIGTVKARIHRALARLEKMLEINHE
jgi:RNA polymerase sigma-70 factor, ECF subfamily